MSIMDPVWMTAIWAHAGASAYAPANTMRAFELAVEQHADGIELDVHLSGDGELVVRHDPTVTRPDGTTVGIAQLSLAELATTSACLPFASSILGLGSRRSTPRAWSIPGSMSSIWGWRPCTPSTSTSWLPVS
ncbi:Glycerophosphoryl diester phosphodiesterase family protein [Propionibacterium cyclohexanicum]|uniref:Glycerophosphoryl diester phosphodiesterase family protein n=1 Tax=Propionibacterium cyclohexanicum TaxID=64702 RepID=A0A1H9RN11_9ACTN|nr:glycerophosphodiester phosphodiesterase family protein [Propionibacterium cyclohexanicum]SER73948.1 Glycerophosphoryl diester phosphodiesterase family protein [Propionibacterium cyclohexanicum]